MPRLLRQKPVRVVLESDESMDPQPAFMFRQLSVREMRQVAGIQERVEAGHITATESIDMLMEALRVGMVDWDNMIDRNGQPMPYDPNRLDEILDFWEAAELLEKSIMQLAVDPEAKKKLESQTASGVDSSANGVGPDSVSTIEVSAK